MYIEANALEKLENLEAVPKMRSLYAHENLIKEISGLEPLTQLVTLNLSDNMLTALDEGLLAVKDTLETLMAGKNRIGTKTKSEKDIDVLLQMSALTSLDLQGNCIKWDPLPQLKAMPKLSVL